MKIIERKRKIPSKYSIFWDADIPMQYYKQEFLEYEQMLIETGQMKQSTADEPHASSNYVLVQFEKFEKKRKIDEKKKYNKIMIRKKVMAQNESTPKRSSSKVMKHDGKVVHFGKMSFSRYCHVKSK